MRMPSAITFTILTTLTAMGCVQGTPMHATEARRVLRLVKTVETDMSVPLAQEYARAMPHIDIQMVDGSGPGGSVSAVQRGAADLAFILADVAYFANLDAHTANDPSSDLRGIAALHTAPVHILALNDHPDFARISVTTPRRIAINSAFSSQFMLANRVLDGYGLKDRSEATMLNAAEITNALTERRVDAVFVTAFYPAKSVAAATRAGAHLLSMNESVAETLRRKYPFVHRVNIPGETYEGQDQPVSTIGVDRVLVCRGDLDETLVHDLTRHFIEALPEILRPLRASARTMDVEQAPATPIPLHRGAAQYYRERELAP